MKTRIKVLLVMLGVSFFSTTTYATIENTENNPVVLEINNQEATVTGVYKGHDDLGYNFSIVDEKGTENTTTFSSVDESVKKSNDLDSKSVVGTTYKITFKVAEDGSKVITALEAQY